MEAAIAWLDQNRDQFKAWPAPKEAPASAEQPAEPANADDGEKAPANDE